MNDFALWRRYSVVRSLRRRLRRLAGSAGRAALWIVKPVVILAGSVYRRTVLRRVRVICVTGSGGKTTTKDLVAAALSSRMRGSSSIANKNCSFKAILRTLRLAKPSDGFCVQELAGGDHGKVVDLASVLRILRPDVSVVLNVGKEHFQAFGSLEAIADHKGKLVESLGSSGVAVLNADDPNVIAQRARCRGRVVTFGLSPEAEVRAEQVVSSWPEPLRFNLVCDGRSLPVRTNVHGRHFAHNFLACLAVCRAMNVDLEAAIEAIATRGSPPKRMQPVPTGSGVTFIRDDFKAPVWSLGNVLAFLGEAVAPRKVAVIGRLSEISGSGNQTSYGALAKEALEVADAVLFVGPSASFAQRAVATHSGQRLLRAFVSPEQALEFLVDYLRPGDLVLLKGPGLQDAQVSKLVNALSAGRESPAVQVSRTEPQPAKVADARPQVAVIGLGNPGRQFDGTPHNVGWQVVDRMARELNAPWGIDHGVTVARAAWAGGELHLVKSRSLINVCGQAIADYCAKSGIPVRDLVVVHDDVSLPLGAVRPRVRGSDGGHKGLRSVLASLRTDEVRRVKVGVGSPNGSMDLKEHVLAPFARHARSEVDAACATAAQYALAAVCRKLEASGTSAAPTGISPSALRDWQDLEPRHAPDSDGSIHALVARFQAEVVSRKKPTARAMCERRIPAILDAFGTWPVDAVDEAAIRDFLGACPAEAVLECQTVLTQLFKSAVRWRLAPRNPTAPPVDPGAAANLG